MIIGFELKRHHFEVVIILMFFIVGLSGCNELGFGDDKQSGDIDKVEIVDYSIGTYIYDWFPSEEYEKVADDFAYSLIGKDNKGYYQVSGTIRNLCGKNLSRVDVKVNFYDRKGDFLLSKIDRIKDFEVASTQNFEVKVHPVDNYFEIIDNIKFEIEVL